MAKENPPATQQQLKEIYSHVASEMGRLVPDNTGTESPNIYSFTDGEEKHLSGVLTRVEVEAVEPSAPEVLHVQGQLRIEYIADLVQGGTPPSVHFQAETDDPRVASFGWNIFREISQYSGVRNVTTGEAQRQSGDFRDLLDEISEPQSIPFAEADALLAVARHLRGLEQFTEPQA